MIIKFIGATAAVLQFGPLFSVEETPVLLTSDTASPHQLLARQDLAPAIRAKKDKTYICHTVELLSLR